MRVLTRKCLVCGSRIRVKIRPDKSYSGGHYFGSFGDPIKGTGEYKKTGSIRISGKSHDVVKWTGKEKRIEYWECEKCFEEASHEGWLEENIEKLYGEKCKDYEPGCACCQAWDVYDTILLDSQGKL